MYSTLEIHGYIIATVTVRFADWMLGREEIAVFTADSILSAVSADMGGRIPAATYMSGSSSILMSKLSMSRLVLAASYAIATAVSTTVAIAIAPGWAGSAATSTSRSRSPMSNPSEYAPNLAAIVAMDALLVEIYLLFTHACVLPTKEILHLF